MAETKKQNPKTTELMQIMEKVGRLESVIAEMAHYTGNEKIILKHKLEKFSPGKKDMTKYRL